MEKRKPEFDLEHDRMAYEIYNFVDNLRFAIENPVKIDADIDRVLICGMGGSGIGGDIIRDFVFGRSRFPITVQRFPELPIWVDSRTFVIVSSYSGNTSETLSMYLQASEKGCPIVIITSGGELERIGKEKGEMVLSMEKGLQPRSALGFNIGYLAAVMDAICGTDCVREIREFLPSMYKYRDRLSGDRSEAWKIAKEIYGRIPVIYATAGIYSSAIRWKGQFNENSKIIAFAGSVPEFNHNEIAGWSEGELRNKCLVLFLYEISAHKEIRKMADASLASLKEYGQDVKVIRIKGRTVIQRTLRTVMVGDYISLHLAHLRGVDPEEVRTIVEFKSRLNKVLSTVKSAGRSRKGK